MLGLQIMMARVRSLMSSSNFSTFGSEKPSSMVVAMVRILAPAEMAMLVLGWCSLLYGVTELINALKIHNEKRKFKKAQEIPVAEEIVEETPAVESTTSAEDDSRYMPTIKEE